MIAAEILFYRVPRIPLIDETRNEDVFREADSQT